MNNKKKIYFTPGPTQLHPSVEKYIRHALDENVCSINHRSQEFMEIFGNTVCSLKKLMNIPEEFSVFFLSSATECMDRMIQNCVEKNSLHFVNGAFAERYFKTAVELNKNAEKIESAFGEGFDFSNLKTGSLPELVCITQNETSTGVALDLNDIYKIKKLFPETILSIDIVSSAPYVNPDFTIIDSAFFSVQKGFGLPAGLGVLIVNEKCISKARVMHSKKVAGSYHNFVSLYDNAQKKQTSETPNVLGIFLLGKICEELIHYGIKKIRSETEDKSKLIYDCLDKNSKLNAFVKSNELRSKTVIAVNTGDKQKIVKKMLLDEGLIVGSGYGKLKDSQIRIANFPMHKHEDISTITQILNNMKD
ncbi:MAG: Phosphoserine aminotransferase [Ignavibacteria bacterium]|nr:Phosphoserine aminotransferase [Ignavibacteria bacterium]